MRYKGVEMIDELQPPRDLESDANEVFGSLKVDPDDVAHAESVQRETLPSFPEEPWFYGLLWKYGQALRIIADVGAAVVGIVSVLALAFLGSTPSAYSGLVFVGFLATLLFDFLMWFLLRLASASVLIVVDAARNIRNTWYVTRYAHYL